MTDLKQYFNPDKKITLMSFPYNFGVIHDFLNAETYQSLVHFFEHCIKDAQPLGKIGDHDDLFYPALCATPSVEAMLKSPQNVLISEAMQQYLCGFFSMQQHPVPNEYIILAAHQHQPPTPNSWAHTDFNIVSFAKDKKVPKGFLNMWQESDCRYTDDSLDAQPDSVKAARYITCIYYLKNPEWQASHGGATGVYSGYHPEIPMVYNVPPLNNSLFFFEINPLSFHCAHGTNMVRNSLIWWYHTSPAYQYFKHSTLRDYTKEHLNQDDFEWWTAPETKKWPLKNDPYYAKYKKIYKNIYKKK